MKIAVISDVTYRSCLPWDPNCLGYYGSESYHALLAHLLSKKGHEVHFYAAQGSSEIANFHPLKMMFGTSVHERTGNITALSLDNSKTEDLLEMDFVIDMTSNCIDIEDIRNYHEFKRYVCYRNGFAAWNGPRLQASKRHYITPSKQNKEIFNRNGFAADYIYYGIPDFYCPGEDDYYFRPFGVGGLRRKDYILFPHRPTPEKGTSILLRLAQELPTQDFVLAGHTPISEHSSALQALKKQAPGNIKFVDIPLEPEHHYYKRELYRGAKAVLSPFHPSMGYYEGFGLSSAEAVACGTPLIITDSQSTRELWIEYKDALYCDGYISFRNACQDAEQLDRLKPENKFSTEDFVNNYIKQADKYQLSLEVG